AARAADDPRAPHLRPPRRRAARDPGGARRTGGAEARGGGGCAVRIAFFGSSLVSAYWNGAATYYRGIIRALARRGHRVTFYEPDAYDRQAHRDIPDPSWAEVVVYPAKDLVGVRRALADAASADVV